MAIFDRAICSFDALYPADPQRISRHNPYIHGHYLNLQLGQGPLLPFPLLSLPPFPSTLSLPLSPPLFFPSLRSRPPVAASGPGDRFSSPSGSGQSPAATRYLVNFRLKISPLVATIFRSFAGNETSNWRGGDWSRVVTYLCKQTVWASKWH